MDESGASRKIIRRSVETTNVELSPEINSVLNKIYLQRNIRNPIELDNSFSQLLPPDSMKDIGNAVEILFSAISQEEKILIVADYDADGATSCAVVIRALKGFGAKNVSYIVPDRFKFGYGLTPEIVNLARINSPDLIITVDNGIASIEGVQAARDAGIKVLITDHHLPGNSVPNANAIVNPNQAGCKFPSKSIAGVGVIFYIMIALRSRLRSQGWFLKNSLTEFNLSELTDIVALGTVADLVRLDHNNRILVSQGLARINKGLAHAGVQALLDIANRQTGHINTTDLGFYVAPRINAAGRLEDMSLGIECLLCDDTERAAILASKLDQINSERKSIQKKMQQQASHILQSLYKTDVVLPKGICLFDNSWHQGVVGLVASKVKDHYHRPVIAFALVENGELKGSARSITGLHIRDTLDAIATGYPYLLQKFGGHAMAAGLSISQENFQEFSDVFASEVALRLEQGSTEDVILSDGGLDSDSFTKEFAELVNMAAPWGQGFEPPVFDNEFIVLESRIVGKEHLKMKLRPVSAGVVDDATRELDAIAFNQSRFLNNPVPERIRAAYKLDINEFRGWQALQLIIEHIEVAPGNG